MFLTNTQTLSCCRNVECIHDKLAKTCVTKLTTNYIVKITKFETITHITASYNCQYNYH